MVWATINSVMALLSSIQSVDFELNSDLQARQFACTCILATAMDAGLI